MLRKIYRRFQKKNVLLLVHNKLLFYLLYFTAISRSVLQRRNLSSELLASRYYRDKTDSSRARYIVKTTQESRRIRETDSPAVCLYLAQLLSGREILEGMSGEASGACEERLHIVCAHLRQQVSSRWIRHWGNETREGGNRRRRDRSRRRGQSCAATVPRRKKKKT